MDYPFARTDVARYNELTAPPLIDAHSWKDLLLDAYLARLSEGTSIFGQQMLYHRLRSARADSREQLQAYFADAPLRTRLETACRGMREADAEISATLFGAALPAAPWWARWLALLPLALLACMAAAMLWGGLWLPALGICGLMLALQAVWHDRVREWERELRALQLMLAACSKAWPDDSTAVRRLGRQLSQSVLARMPLLRDYSEWLLLRNISHYFASRALVAHHLALLRSCYERVAALEADLALARHLAGAGQFCWSGSAERGELELHGMLHPLLPAPLALDLSLRGAGAFISGQNGAGKSTLLRAVGLNAVTARAFGFCYARSARLPEVPVYTSMQTEDALESGESLYLAELRRARELLTVAGEGSALFIVDEIFRGTNHLESVSAAAAVMEALAQRGMVLVSSHNLVLATLLKGHLAPLCVRRDGQGMRLEQGILGETNGIALLGQQGFSLQIQAKASQVHGELLAQIRERAALSG